MIINITAHFVDEVVFKHGHAERAMHQKREKTNGNPIDHFNEQPRFGNYSIFVHRKP